MKPRLGPKELDFLQAMARGPEGQILRETVLKPWLEQVDVVLRKADTETFRAAQGEAGVLMHLIDLLSPHAPKPMTRRLVIDGAYQEFRVDPTRQNPGH
jgi:hypothetical protein